MKMYLLEKIKDGSDYKKGDTIWACNKCKGWKVLEIREIELSSDGHQR